MIRWQENKHTIKMWFWRLNYPLVLLIYFFLPEQVLILYLALCSIYANEETSASAREARSEDSRVKSLWRRVRGWLS